VLPSRFMSRAGLAVTAVLLATAAPAVASPAPEGATGTTSQQPTVPVPAKPARVVLIAPAGFDWGDAAIGAGATLGLVLATAGGGVALSRRRARHPTVRPVAS
jgi:hypothetical protein